MTNNNPNIFAAVIDANEASKISSEPINSDIYELKAGAVIMPIEQLNQMVGENNDAYFLATTSRLAAKGIVKLG